MGILTCPKCGTLLNKLPKQYICSNNHCFDRAKSGYINLLLDNQKNSKMPGDNKLMVDARNNFLQKGYYKPLLEGLIECAKKYHPMTILDIGCGEGYYTNGLFGAVGGEVTGIDISKLAIDKSAKRCKAVDFAVASAFHLPVLDNSCDMLLNLFAPFCGDEFSRVLKETGLMIIVIPSEGHLWELKSIVYPEPYKNEPRDYGLSGFNLVEKIVINSQIEIKCNQDILDLFTMTPYYYKTSQDNYRKLERINTLTTAIGFEVLVYSKEKASAVI